MVNGIPHSWKEEINLITYHNKSYNCPLEMTVDLIGGKWKVLLLWNLSGKVLRFNEISRLFPGISTKMLTQQLRDMEDDGLINRTVYPQVPPKVEYTLTQFGNTLMPVLYAMQEWGTDYMNNQEQVY